MYAVGIKDGVWLAGNEGLQVLHGKSRKQVLDEIYTMRHICDEVCIVNDFTQKMCEMDNNILVDYVRNHNIFKVSHIKLGG